MHSRAEIIAALLSGGALDVETLAGETLAGAGHGPGADASLLVVRLHYDFRILPPDRNQRCTFDGHTIGACHDVDPCELKLNTLIGVGCAVNYARHLHASPCDLYRLAIHFAMPEIDRFDIVPAWVGLPGWIVQANRHHPHMTAGLTTGVRHAAAAR